MINKDEAKGKVEQAKGAVKEKIGEWTGDPELEAEGQVDQAAGKAQETYGTAKRKAEEAAEAIADEITKDRTR